MLFKSKSIKELNEKVVNYFMKNEGLDEELCSFYENEYEQIVIDQINEFVKDSNNYKFVFDNNSDLLDDCQFFIEKDDKLYVVYIDEDYVSIDEIETFDPNEFD